MRISEFENVVSAKKMKIEKRLKYTDQEIFIAEGYCPGDRDDMSPHYKTMYAISDGPERIKVGEFFITPIIFPIKNKDDRMFEAQIRAQEFLDGMKSECPA